MAVVVVDFVVVVVDDGKLVTCSFVSEATL
jgi:hypothetical protein